MLKRTILFGLILLISLGLVIPANAGVAEQILRGVEKGVKQTNRRLNRQLNALEHSRSLTHKERKNFSKIAEKISKNITPRDPVVRKYAIQHTTPRQISAQSTKVTYSKFEQILLLYQDLRDKDWKYASDPLGNEYVASPRETIRIGLAGDCDDFAVFMASMIGAIGGQTRVVVAISPRGGHAYPEIYMGRRDRIINEKINDVGWVASCMVERNLDYYRYHYHTDDGAWLNLDWSADFPGGPLFNSYISIAVYPNGNFELIKKSPKWVRLAANLRTKKLQSLLSEFSKSY